MGMALQASSNPSKIDGYNLLVSYELGDLGEAREDVLRILRSLGDQDPTVRRTAARGLLGVRTALDPRIVTRELRGLYSKDPFSFGTTIKWIPIDLWVPSEMEAMREGVMKLRDRIRRGERWAMVVEKRRYGRHHKAEIISELAGLIEGKVDLKAPEKVLRVELVGRYAGLAVMEPREVFSARKPHA